MQIVNDNRCFNDKLIICIPDEDEHKPSQLWKFKVNYVIMHAFSGLIPLNRKVNS